MTRLTHSQLTTVATTHSALGEPLGLPCGAVLKNRIAKSAMSDALGDGRGNPTDAQIRLYERWAEGGVAISFIGEVQVGPGYPEKPGNLVFGKGSDLAKLRELSRRAQINGAHLWPQLGHAGALSHPPVSNPAGPSALDLDGLSCRALSTDEVEALPTQFAKAAQIAKDTGFSGVHIHAGHGFLLSQFLSPLFNHRNDAYGGSIEGRARILIDIITAVRETVGADYPIGTRINSSDQLEGGLTETDSLEVIKMLDHSSVDLIDISGGTYFPGAKSSSDAGGSGPYFVEFAKRAKQETAIPLMVTGGFKQRQDALSAVESDSADVVGVARALVLNPSLAATWLTDAGGDPQFPKFDPPIPEGGITAWFTQRLTAIGEDRDEAFDKGLVEAVEEYEARDAMRSIEWNGAHAAK